MGAGGRVRPTIPVWGSGGRRQQSWPGSVIMLLVSELELCVMEKVRAIKEKKAHTFW